MKKYLALATAMGMALALAVTPNLIFAAQANVSMKDDAFSPVTTTISAGDSVIWTNMGTMNHTATADSGLFDSGTMAPGDTYSHTFITPGTYAYYCRFHGGPGGVGMAGTIVVLASTTAASTASSTGEMFGNTGAASSTASTTSTSASTTAYLALSSYSGMAGDTVSAIGSNFSPGETITLNFNGTASTATADSSGNFTTTLRVPSGSGSISIMATGATSGLTASNTFFVENASSTTGTGTASTTSATSTPTNFSTPPTSTGVPTSLLVVTPTITLTNSSSTGTTTLDLPTLQGEITDLQSQLNDLQDLFAVLLNIIFSQPGMSAGSTTGIGSGSSTPPLTNTGGMIDQQGASVRAGTSIDFGGHHFGREEHVRVMQGGSQVGDAFTNSTGDFSTGSMSVPAIPGTYIYTFTGVMSGIAGSTTITVTP